MTRDITKETWHVRPDYGQENVYRVWNQDDNYHDDTSPEAMDARTRVMQASPALLEALKNARLWMGARRDVGEYVHEIAEADNAISQAEGKE